jgi:hypothetical protein
LYKYISINELHRHLFCKQNANGAFAASRHSNKNYI